jgi:hypothetical protein
MLLAKCLADPLRDFLDGADRGDAMHEVSLLIPIEHGGGLLSVGAKPGSEGLGIVVGALLERASLGEAG